MKAVMAERRKLQVSARRNGHGVQAIRPAGESSRTDLAPPVMVIFSSDPQLRDLAGSCAPAPWKIDHRNDPAGGREVLSQPNLRLVILDDEVVNEEARGWLLDRIHRFVPQAMLIYISSMHTPESERRARSYAAQYYTAKPLDMERTRRVLDGFAKLALERDANIRVAAPPNQ